MPARYDHRTQNYVIRCSHCGDERRTVSATESADTIDINGERIADFIRFLPARSVFHSWCRSCERAARNANPNRQQRRQGAAAAGGGRMLTRKFGVELELIFPRDVTRQQIVNRLEAAGCTNWKAKGDGSLSGGNGIEVVTPPLSGEAGLETLRTGMRVLREMGAKVNRTCGTHVHHDVRDLDVDAFKRVIKTWANNQHLIDGLVSPSRRDGANMYCRPLRDNELATIMRVTAIEQLRSSYMVERYRTINICAYGRYGTIEIRQHQGTVDFEKVRSWIMLGQAVIDGAKAGSQAMTSQPSVRDMLDRIATWLDETAKTFLLGRAVEFGHATVVA